MSQQTTTSTSNTSSTSSTSSTTNAINDDHKNYKKNLELIAKYCIIGGLIILLSCFIIHLISYLYKEKRLPYGVSFFRKLFLILGISSLCVGIFCAICWNYYI